MQVDIILDNARIYNIDRVDIAKDEKFVLATDAPEGTSWFFDNDEALEMSVNGRDAEITATNPGKSTILMMDASRKILKEIYINVVEKVELPVHSLNARVVDKILKTTQVFKQGNGYVYDPLS